LIHVISSPKKIQKKSSEKINSIFQKKTNIFNFDIPAWGLRFSRNLEENLSPFQFPSFPSNTTRFRKRYSYIDLKPGSSLEHLRIDLSEVQELTGSTLNPINYELEIELLQEIPIERLAKIIFLFYGWMNSATIDEHVVNIEIKNLVLQNFISTIYSNFNLETISPHIPTNLWKKPINLDLGNLKSQSSNYAVSLKYDGKRGYIYMCNYGIFFCCPACDVIKLGPIDSSDLQSLFGTIYDVEYVLHKGVGTFYIFDLLFYAGTDFRNHNFLIRQDRCKSSISLLDGQLYSNNRCCIKHFYTEETFEKRLTLAITQYNDISNHQNRKRGHESTVEDIPLDGLIFQPINEGYQNNCTYKWKPIDKLTIDFKLIRDPNIVNRYRLVSNDSTNSNGSKLIRFIGSNEHPIVGELFIDSLFGSDPDGKIVECCWSNEKQNFEPVRYRHDRLEPNDIKIALNVYEEYFDNNYCSLSNLQSLFSN
jgi:hypothetical protein